MKDLIKIPSDIEDADEEYGDELVDEGEEFKQFQDGDEDDEDNENEVFNLAKENDELGGDLLN
jgi:hypothetical protein